MPLYIILLYLLILPLLLLAAHAPIPPQPPFTSPGIWLELVKAGVKQHRLQEPICKDDEHVEVIL
jgi:hypothetical protein